MRKFIKEYNDFQKVNELSEFNLQRMNPDSVRASVHVDDPALSTNAFDKHQDKIRLAMSRIGDILKNLSGTNVYKSLRGRLAMEDQDIQSMKILRILKVDSINYDAYISLFIGGEEYWGVVRNILSAGSEFESEVFKDRSLLQAKEWMIKIKGLVKNTIKEWLKPEPGAYRLLNDEVICYSTETGKQLRMQKGIEIELVRSHSDKIVVKHGSDYYNLVGDNYVYFNWWFEKVS